MYNFTLYSMHNDVYLKFCMIGLIKSIRYRSNTQNNYSEIYFGWNQLQQKKK